MRRIGASFRLHVSRRAGAFEVLDSDVSGGRVDIMPF